MSSRAVRISRGASAGATPDRTIRSAFWRTTRDMTGKKSVVPGSYVSPEEATLRPSVFAAVTPSSRWFSGSDSLRAMKLTLFTPRFSFRYL